MGFTLLYLSLIVLISLSAAFIRASALTWPEFWSTVTTPRVISFVSADIWRIVRGGARQCGVRAPCCLGIGALPFPGQEAGGRIGRSSICLADGCGGIALTALYAGNGWIGQFFEPLGIKIAFTPLGIFVALTFIGLPFVVRTVQPVLRI